MSFFGNGEQLKPYCAPSATIQDDSSRKINTEVINQSRSPSRPPRSQEDFENTLQVQGWHITW